MARIPNDELARIKTEVSLLALVEQQGYTVVKQGKDMAIRCPFHADDTPSLIISPKTNLYHCFGCGAAGSVIDWVMNTQKLSFRHAVEVLQQSNPSLAAKPVTHRQLETLPTEQPDTALMQQVIDYYHETLLSNDEALAYLDKRGLNDPALIQTFKLGYANRTLAYRLPEKQYKAGKQLRTQLQALGILRASGHEHFNGSLVVPVCNEKNTVVEVYGRKVLGNRLRKGTPQHLYLPGAHAGVWNAAALHDHSEVILCESLIDAMTFWVNGFTNVTASYGTQGFTEAHLQCFKQLKVKTVVIAYDNDEAGNTAALTVTTTLNGAGFACTRAVFPKGYDANQYALEVTPAKKSLALVIKQAEPLGELRCEPAPTPLAAESSPPPALPVEPVVEHHTMTLVLGAREYRIKGLDKLNREDQLRVNLRVAVEDFIHLDTFDLYSAKARHGFIEQAAIECGVEAKLLQRDLGKVVLALEHWQDQQRQVQPALPTVTLSEDERRAALALLTDPNLLGRILDDFSHCGVVGEETNKLVGYLAAVSRRSDKPLAVLIQSTSAAGKSSLMEAVLKLVPPEDKVQYSAMTGQSLFYMGQTNLKHKILAIAEEEGASTASYALKLLQSEGEITIASTGKDDTTGDLVTKEYKVEGPVMLFLTTTAIDIDEELLNRCLVLTVDEDRAQTEAIHQQQRFAETLEGLLQSQTKSDIITLHQNAQRLLRPLKVVNPYANQLTFLSDKTRTRRDHQKYLMLIRAIALLHQYQREIKTIDHNGQPLEYIEVTLDDIQTANQLAHEVLGRTLDELPPQTRKLLQLIKTMVEEQCTALDMAQKDYRFSRKQIRAATGWGNTQLKLHCHRLEELEYLLVHRGGRGQSFEYELLYDGELASDQPHLMGLIDSQHLKTPDYDAKKSGLNAPSSGSSRPQVGAGSGCGRAHKNPGNPVKLGLIDESTRQPVKTVISLAKEDASHRSALAASPA